MTLYIILTIGFAGFEFGSKLTEIGERRQHQGIGERGLLLVAPSRENAQSDLLFGEKRITKE